MSHTYTRRSHSEELSQPSRSASQSQGMSNSAMLSGGTPSASAMGRSVSMPASLRQRMENSFGADFSGVRFFESQQVADNGADAVTLGGGNVGFAPGKLDFSSKQGQELIGHELAHVVSHARGEVTGHGFLGNASLEAQADRQGEMAAAGQSVYTGPVTPLSASTVASAEGPMQAKKKKDEPASAGPQTDILNKKYAKIQSMDKSDERTTQLIDLLVDASDSMRGLDLQSNPGDEYERDSIGLTDATGSILDNMSDDEIERFYVDDRLALLEQMDSLYNDSYRGGMVNGMSHEEAHYQAMNAAMTSKQGMAYDHLLSAGGALSRNSNKVADFIDSMRGVVRQADEYKKNGVDESEWDPEVLAKSKKYSRANDLGEKYMFNHYEKAAKKVGKQDEAAKFKNDLMDKVDERSQANSWGNYAKERAGLNSGVTAGAGRAADPARMAELNLNDFSNDPELEGEKLLGATTSDVAALKMLKNVTPEMLQDPVFMEQMGRFLGGNLANLVSKQMSSDNSKIQNMIAFRGNETALINAGQFLRMGISDDVTDRMANHGKHEDEHNGPLNAIQEVNEYMLTPESAGAAELMRTAAQGMNGHDFNNTERSNAMMNTLMLRGVVPKINQRSMDNGDNEGIAFGRNLMQMVNSPDTSSDPEFMRQFGMQMMNEVGTQRNNINTSAMAVKNKSPHSAPAPAPKKKWYQFWK